MDALTAAADRLSAAIDQLENSLKPLDEAQKRHVRDAAEIASLTHERETLLTRIADLEDETRSLASVNEQVEGRLDVAISDIRAALSR
jgi:predicted  nucleic acid-binding Zn-ribbon protein